MRLPVLLAVLTVVGCGDNNAKTDAPGVLADTPLDGVAVDGNPLTPDTLAGTGLCLDAGCQQISPDARPYVPAYQLWSDGATKKRWIYLPPGTQIDTSDMNFWKFPVGTKLWKEFTRDGIRVETRYIVKLADEAAPPPAITWYYVSYAWNAAQDATVAVTNGATDVNGTGHDIPSRNNCRTCHDNMRGTDHQRGRVLGFGAMSLDRTPATPGDVTLSTLVTEGKLTSVPAAPASAGAPYFPTTFTAHEQAAFGYMHANCGHCHNPSSGFHDSFPLELRFDVTKLSVATAPEVATTVNVVESQTYTGLPVGSLIVKPHDTANSVMYGRMTDTNFLVNHMPALGTEITDVNGGVAAIATWIGDL